MVTLDFVKEWTKWEELSGVELVGAFEGTIEGLIGRGNPVIVGISGRPDEQSGYVHTTFKLADGWWYAQEYYPSGDAATPIFGYRTKRNTCELCEGSLGDFLIEVRHSDSKHCKLVKLPCLGHVFCSGKCVELFCNQ